MSYRRPLALGLLAAAGALPLACTSLLGDFNVGTGVTTGDGGGDGGPTTDSPVGADSDAGPTTDAGPDAPAVHPLTCSETPDPRVHVGTVNSGGSGNLDRLLMLTHAGNTGPITTVLVPSISNADGNYQQSIQAFTFPTQETTPPVVEQDLLGYRLLDAKRYATGIAALVYDYSLAQALIYKLPDDGSGWDTGHAVTMPGNISSMGCRLVGTFEPITSAGDESLVAFTWNTGSCSNPDAPTLAATHQKDSQGPSGLSLWSAPPPTNDAGAPVAYDIPNQSIVVDGTKVHVFVQPSYAGSSGPQPGFGAAEYQANLSDMSQVQSFLVPLATPTSLVYAMASHVSLASPSSANSVFVGGSSAVSFFVGETASSSLDSLAVETTLSATTVASIGDLPVGKGSNRWTNFGGTNPSENYLGVGQAGKTGANFYWFNKLGQAIAQHSSSKMNTLFSTDAITVIDVNMLGAPITLLGDLEFAFAEASDAGANYYDIWAVHVQCK